MNAVINRFDGDYRFLSNFYPCWISYMDLVFRSTEAAYQAAKCLNPADRERFTKLEPNEAKRLGRKVSIRPDWDDMKLDVMRELLRIKFEYPNLKEKLLATGDEELIEGNTWGDTYWGIWNGVGENHLGKLLMELRASLRKSVRIGVTERGDASVDMSWVQKLPEYDGAILITKNITPEFACAVLTKRDKVIVHATCTGYGFTVLEPCVPPYRHQICCMKQLVQQGFPIERVILRVDPIIPTPKGIALAERVMEDALANGFKKVRVSVIDLYPHVRERLMNAGLPLPFQGFQAESEQFAAVDEMLRRVKRRNPFVQIMSCAEPMLKEAKKIGCVSREDLELLGLEYDNTETAKQRKDCLCLGCKSEMLTAKSRCRHQCLYCYWRD